MSVDIQCYGNFSCIEIVLTVFKTVFASVAQTILDVGWGGVEGVMLKWEHTTSKWEDLTG